VARHGTGSGHRAPGIADLKAFCTDFGHFRPQLAAFLAAQNARFRWLCSGFARFPCGRPTKEVKNSFTIMVNFGKNDDGGITYMVNGAL
jgi:hypothetical protein